MQKKNSDPLLEKEKNACEELSDEAWIKFLRRHWKPTLLMVGGAAVAAIVAIFVFLWVVADMQATGAVPAVLGQWTVGYCIIFILNLILWELVSVGSWAIPIVLIIYFLWYKKLPDKERKEYEGKGRRRKSAEDSGFSFFVGVVWLILVWIGGKWNLAFQDWTFNDWVYTWLTACLSVLVVVGILGTMYVIYSLAKTMPGKKGDKNE